MQPTAEQLAIIEHFPRPKQRILVNAGAGSGKTSTCRWIVERHGLCDLFDGGVERNNPDGAGHRFLYLAFNKAIQVEAKAKMRGLDVVECRTMHSLALEYAKERVPNFRYGEAGVSPPCKSFLRKFFLSTSAVLPPPDHDSFLQEAHQAWQRMQQGTMAMSHDAYCKFFCSDSGALAWLCDHYDTIICDEAQDTAVVVLDFLMRLPQCVYFIGDQHQAIYAFRNAQNALQRVGEETVDPVFCFPLSQSFRFGDVIAKLANHLLQQFGVQSVALRGTGDASRLCSVDWREAKRWAVIGRSNAQVFAHAVQEAQSGKTLAFVSRDAKVPPVMEAIQFALAKYSRHHQLQKKRLENDLLAAEEAEDLEVMRTLKFLKKHGAVEVERMLAKIKAAVRPAARAELLLGTVHGHKGLEWDAVYLLDDFADLTRLQGRLEGHCREHQVAVTHSSAARLVEEVNLVYVAITRAKRLLALPPKLQAFF